MEQSFFDKETQKTIYRFTNYHEEKVAILEKNCTLFAKMIKLEVLINKVYARLELATVEAVKMYAQIEFKVKNLKLQDPNFIDISETEFEFYGKEKNTQEETKMSPTENEQAA